MKILTVKGKAIFYNNKNGKIQSRRSKNTSKYPFGIVCGDQTLKAADGGVLHEYSAVYWDKTNI